MIEVLGFLWGILILLVLYNSEENKLFKSFTLSLILTFAVFCILYFSKDYS